MKLLTKLHIEYWMWFSLNNMIITSVSSWFTISVKLSYNKIILSLWLYNLLDLHERMVFIHNTSTKVPFYQLLKLLVKKWWDSQVAQWSRNLLQQRRCGFNPWVGKNLWRNKWQPTPGFLPRKLHGQRTLTGYSPWGLKRVRHDLVTE